jgi:tetratricopeptide (TPR) repeat protein
MSLDLHRRAEELMERADAAAAMGEAGAAQRHYAEAADLEIAALATIPRDRARTRGTVALSAVSLYRKAGRVDDAIQVAHRLLGQDQQPSWAVAAIETQLDEMRSERRARELGFEVTPHVFEWVLRGPAILVGEGPIGVVLQKIDQVMKYGTRVGEYLSGYAVRRIGPPPRAVRDLMGMTLSEPMAGSFRFRVRLLRQPMQTELFPLPTSPSAEDIAAAYLNIISAAAEPESPRLSEVVPQAEYQEAFLQLVRSLAPDGRQVLWVDVGQAGIQQRPVTRLSHHTAISIRERLIGRSPTPGEAELEEVLRALDLNHGWIVLGERAETRCYVDKESPVLEDVVGPLVNRRVRVRVYWKGQRRMIRDIEALESDDGVS